MKNAKMSNKHKFQLIFLLYSSNLKIIFNFEKDGHLIYKKDFWQKKNVHNKVLSVLNM